MFRGFDAWGAVNAADASSAARADEACRAARLPMQAHAACKATCVLILALQHCVYFPKRIRERLKALARLDSALWERYA